VKILEGDQGDEEGNHPAQDEQSSNSGDLEEKINYLWDWAECEIGMAYWKRGGFGRMCRGTYLLDALDQ